MRPLIAGSMSKKPFLKKYIPSQHNKSYPNCDKIDDMGFYLPNHQDLTVDEIYRQEKRLGTFPQKMQYGGMADMSAAPMVQPRKKKKQQSGFRTKYSKGGGVRSAKYKV